MPNPSWPSRHLSLANALDDRPTDLPHLLRRMAQQIDELKLNPMEIGDLVVHSEMREDGPWWSITLYWQASDDASR